MNYVIIKFYKLLRGRDFKMKRKWVYGCLVTAAVLLMAGCGAEQAAVMPNQTPEMQNESGVVSDIQKEQVQAQAKAPAQPQEQIAVQPAQSSAPSQVSSAASSQPNAQVQASQAPAQTQAPSQPKTQVQSQAQAQVQTQTPVYGGYEYHHGGGHHRYQTSAACNQCYGSGQCPTCYGSGYYHNQVCPTCTTRHGSCGYCNGTGRLS